MHIAGFALRVGGVCVIGGFARLYSDRGGGGEVNLKIPQRPPRYAVTDSHCLRRT